MRNCESFPNSERKERKHVCYETIPNARSTKNLLTSLAQIYSKLHLLMANGVERSFLRFLF
jgi:hypothetical protein